MSGTRTVQTRFIFMTRPHRVRPCLVSQGSSSPYVGRYLQDISERCTRLDEFMFPLWMCLICGKINLLAVFLFA